MHHYLKGTLAHAIFKAFTNFSSYSLLKDKRTLECNIKDIC